MKYKESDKEKKATQRRYDLNNKTKKEQYLEALILHYHGILKQTLLKLIVDSEGYSDKVLEQINVVDTFMDQYRYHFGISNARIGSIKEKEK